MKRLFLLFVVSAILAASCSKRPEAGDFKMPEWGEMSADPQRYEVELCCSLTSGSGIVECGAFVSDGEVETRHNGSLDGSTIRVQAENLSSGTAYSYRFWISNGSYEILSKSSKFSTLPGPEIIDIPDPVFKACLLNDFDMDGDGELSQDEADHIRSFEYENKGIISLKGLERMVNLKSISVNNNSNIIDVPLAHPEKITRLGISDTNVDRWDFREMTSLVDYGGNNLPLDRVPLFSTDSIITDIHICCRGGGERIEDPLYFNRFPKVRSLNTSGYKLNAIDFSKNTHLNSLWIGDSHYLKFLDLSACPNLELICISYCTRLDTVYVHPDVVIEDLEIESDDCSAVIVHGPRP